MDILTPQPVDEDLLGWLLQRLEATLHRGDWDTPPRLYVLYDAAADGGATDEVYEGLMAASSRLGPPVRLGNYAAQMMMHEGVLCAGGAAPWEGLRTIAMNLAYELHAEPIQRMRAHLTRPGVLGFAVVTMGLEAHLKGEEARQFFLGKVDLRDRASVETRRLIAFDTNRHHYSVDRPQWGSPVLLHPDVHGGDIPTSLRILIDAVLGDTPPIEEFSIRYPTLSVTHGA